MQIFRIELPAIKECLEGKGRDDLLPDVEADFESRQNMRRFDFPEPERLLEEGFVPRSTSPFDQSGTESDLAVSESCTQDVRAGDEGVAHALELHQLLSEDWMKIIVNDVLESDDEMFAQERFGWCMRRHGVPEKYTVASTTRSPGGTVEGAFLGWVSRRISNGQNSSNGVEDAPLYIECGQPVWDTRERLLRERRETYLETHFDQLSELSELLSDAEG